MSFPKIILIHRPGTPTRSKWNENVKVPVRKAVDDQEMAKRVDKSGKELR